MIFWIFAWEGAGGISNAWMLWKKMFASSPYVCALDLFPALPPGNLQPVNRVLPSNDQQHHIGIQWCNVMRIIKLSQYQTCNKTGSFSWDFGPRDLLIGALGFSTFMNSVALNHLAKTCPRYIWRPRNITFSIMPFDITACELARQLDRC